MGRKGKLTDEQLHKLYSAGVQKANSDDLIKEFVNSKKLINVKSSTIKRYYDVFHILDRDMTRMGLETPLADLRTDEIESLILFWQDDPITPATINGRLRVMRTYYKFLFESKYRKDHPMKQVKSLREPIKIKDTLEEKEIKQMADWFKMRRSFAGFRDLVMFQLILETGLRIGEVIGIQLEDLRGTVIHVVEAKGLRQRVVFISKEMRLTLDLYLEIRGSLPTPYLFVNNEGTQLKRRTFQDAIKYAKEACGIEKDITPHALRRTYAKFAVLAGMDAFSLASLLGHSSVVTTQRYVSIYGKNLEEQAKKRGEFSKYF